MKEHEEPEQSIKDDDVSKTWRLLSTQCTNRNLSMVAIFIELQFEIIVQGNIGTFVACGVYLPAAS